MKSIMHNMMMQSTKSAELMAQLRIIHFDMENQLQLLRAKIQHHEEAWRAERSNGAAARTDVQLANKRTMTSPLPLIIPDQQVLQATAYVVPLVATQINDEVQDDDKSLKPPPGSASTSASAGAAATGPRRVNAWMNFCQHIRQDSKHIILSGKVPFTKKGKYMSAVWATMSKDDQLAYRSEDSASWPSLPAPCADILEKVLKDEDGTSEDKASEKKSKRRKISDETSSDDDMLANDDDFKIADWTLGSLCKHFKQAWGEVFVEKELNAKSLWYIGQLLTCRDVLDRYDTTKTDVMKIMLRKAPKTMLGINELIKDTCNDQMGISHSH